MALLKALIIDDEEDICFLLKNMLKSLDFEATSAGTLKDGFEALKSASFNVIFLDINLPDGSGLEAIEKIKKTISDNIKIIMISAFDGFSERKIAEQKGANYFIGKPLTKDKIIFALKANDLL